MGIVVTKFGGSSLADAGQFRKVRDILLADENRKYVVPSAPGRRDADDAKVTDLLYACHTLAAEGRAHEFEETFSAIRERYLGIVEELGLSPECIATQLEQARFAILSGMGPDYAASRGEFLNGLLLSAYLGWEFIDAAEVIFFDAAGRFDAERTQEVLSARLGRTEYAVIPGFYGSLPNGEIKTFTRGGSDVTGAIVARAAGAELYENWTDVSGFLMADPRIVKRPKEISVITYRELRELAYMGATVLHEEAIFPVRAAGIPINIRNTNAPEDAGTMIVPRSDSNPDTVITGVAGRKGFSSITIEKDRMNTEVGFGRKVLNVLEDFGISFEHAPTGIDTMSVVVATAAIAPCKDAIIGRIFRDANADSVTIEDDIALIAIVGRGMVRNKGTAGRVLTSIADRDINIRMIDQGSGENNIIVGVSESDYTAALQAIYHEFVRGA